MKVDSMPRVVGGLMLGVLAGCVSPTSADPNYGSHANAALQNVPRMETETAQQRADREASQKAMGITVQQFSNADIIDPPKLIRHVAPGYPTAALRKKIGGTVNVGIVVDTEGRVILAKIISSTDPVFEASALKAVKQWRFEAAKVNGVAVNVNYVIPVQFDPQ